jgi:DNA topoisomerase-1
MGSLVIVESPAKARTINKILGKSFTVKASVGHVKDLPQKKLGVDVEDGFKSEYGIIPGKEKVLKELKQAAKKADRIYLAPDPDREGEAIAYHIATEVAGKGEEDKVFRVTFNEITSRAVQEALTRPGKIDMDKVEAQQARRVLDRLVGYNLSPLLWKKIQRGLSAGRVQSVAVRLVVDREREIEAFNKQEYWSIPAGFASKEPPAFKAKLHRYKGDTVISRSEEEGRKFLITGEDEASRIMEEVRKGPFSISRVEKKKRRRSPAAPFITSTLQQEASRRLGFSAKRTMSLAQQLYEGVELGGAGAAGMITYMRTDSVRVAAEAQNSAREFIKKEFGERYVPAKPPRYKSKKSAQEAHEAIRPTSMERAPVVVKKHLSRDQARLYELIWNRFVASQMKPAELEQTAVDIAVAGDKDTVFRATGQVIKFHGFMALYTESIDDTSSNGEENGEGILPPMKEGESLELKEIEKKQHFTQPPPRYTEASLVKTLEEKGIGRPSTYASILSTIVDRKYVEKDQGRFTPTELGSIVNDYLVEKFADLLDAGFTAKMETRLDRIETGKHRWDKVVKDFYKPFNRDMEQAASDTKKLKPEDVATDEICEKCGSPMVIRWGRHGRFLACTDYPKCKSTRPLEGERKAPQEEATDEVCEKCGSPMVIKSGRFGRFMACTNYPDCKNTKSIPTGVKCPEDGGEMVERRTRKGKAFWSCSNYPKCKFATWNRPVAEPCPSCGATFTVTKRERGGGEYRACDNKECGWREDKPEK